MAHLIWLHEDCLRNDCPARHAAGANAHAIHVWDDAYLRRQYYSFKRLVFLYENLCSLDVTIYAGDTHDTLRHYINEHHITTLFVPSTPNPAIQHIITKLRKTCADTTRIDVVDDTPFVSLPKPIKARRFFGYWKKVEPYALTPAGIGKGGTS